MKKTALQALISKQLSNLFTFDEATDGPLLEKGLDRALPRVEHCFSRIRQKYYDPHKPTVDPFHSGKYCIFLYCLARELYREAGNEGQLCDRLYYLNRTLNSIDLYYEVELPQVFFLDHPLGSILGRAQYGEYFSFGQAVTVGNNKGTYPTFGEYVKIHAGSMVIGDTAIGKNVIVSANTVIKDSTIPDSSIVFGQSPNLVIKPLGSIEEQHWPVAFFRTEE